MPKGLTLGAVLVLAIGALALIRQGSAEERAIRALLAEAQVDALAGVNRRKPQLLDAYFATATEGAQAAGLAATQQAYQAFVADLPPGASVQVHSFAVRSLRVHKDAGLARLTYQVHFGLERGGATLLSAKAMQNLALLKTARGWRISGGDAPQLDDMTGVWSR